jgi:hypothetical protein
MALVSIVLAADPVGSRQSIVDIGMLASRHSTGLCRASRYQTEHKRNREPKGYDEGHRLDMRANDGPARSFGAECRLPGLDRSLKHPRPPMLTLVSLQIL